jgi:uncharacterized membrane protein YjjP (DUF1212 family)
MALEKLNLFPLVNQREIERGDPSIAFVIKLGRALHQFGTPAHRLEEAMSLVLLKLGLEGQFFSTPTGIFASFGAPEEQRTSLIRVEPGQVNLEKLTLLDDLTNQVILGNISSAEGASRIDDIVAAPPRYGPLLSAACFGLASGTASRFIGGGWREVLASTMIGITLGLLALIAERSKTVSRVFEPVAAILASSLAIVAAQFFPPISIYITTLAGLIVLIPGLTLTIAITEIAMRNLISGTARLMGAALLFLEIGFGVALGSQIIRLLPAMPLFKRSIILPYWTEWIALLLAPFAFTVLFKARPKDLGLIAAAGIVGFGGARLGTFLLGPELGVCLGALLLGIASNLYARLLNRPAAVALLPGLMLIVPGSIGFGSVSSFLEKDVVSGVETAFKMVLVAVGLVTGLLLANVTLPPRKAL